MPMAEGLLVEQNMSNCYELIENFRGCIYSHVSAMNKQSECPEECKEAISSLIYAAARFSDLPELRELRTIFTERYGSSLESYTNKEFVERLKAKAPTKEMKLQLLQDLAQEFSINWDIKALEPKLYTSIPKQEHRRHGFLSNTDDEKWQKNKDDSVPEKNNQDSANRLSNGRGSITKRNDKDLNFRGRKDVTDDDKWQKNKDDAVPEKNNQDSTNRLSNGLGSITKRNDRDLNFHGIKDVTGDRHGMPTISEDKITTELSQGGLKKSSSLVGSVSKDEVDDERPFYYKYTTPPYLKTKYEKDEISSEEPTKLKGHIDKEAAQHIDHPVVEDKPKPRSVRSRNLKPPPGRSNVGISENDGVTKMDSRGTRQEDARRSLRTIHSEDGAPRDEEDTNVDDLLMHFSKKKSPDESGKKKIYLKPPPSRRSDVDHGEYKWNRMKSDLDIGPARVEPTTSTGATKRHVRATSLQPEMLSGGEHVHPNLPDYEELAARLANIR
ncbi:uncharacterized protein LOC112006440 isoform X2 [Quercus suber]|uniref:uncharacterized protein LOC112006440 isoform X2 n=1 Tax=Quercus suber TaxID=58331 RepID=UPI0032E01689